MKGPSLFVPMKAGGPAGGALVVLGFVAVLAAAVFYFKHREGAAGSAKQAPGINTPPGYQQ